MSTVAFLERAFKNTLGSELYFYYWVKKPSKDIAHYKCVNCDYVQNSPFNCKWCNYTYTDMILCNGKNVFLGALSFKFLTKVLVNWIICGNINW